MSDLLNESAEAVLFFDEHLVGKEMMYTEFEAILDGVVGLQEYLNQTKRAAFVTITGQLKVTAVVLFTIRFDRNGFADRSWNIPLRHLADTAGRGPDLGAGAIRLSCRSQCSVAWHSPQLWDPDLSAAHNTFTAIREAISRNRLGLVMHMPPAVPVASNWMGFADFSDAIPTLFPSDFPIPAADPMTGSMALPNWNQPTFDNSEERLKIARVIKELRLQNLTQRNHFEEENARLKLDASKRIQEQEIEIARLRSQQESLHSQNMALREQAEAQRAQLQTLKMQFDARLREMQEHERGEVQSVMSHYESLIEQRVTEETAKLREDLELRNMELLYRHEVTKQLREELTLLRKDKIRLVNAGADKFLEKLESLGVSFIAFHPGAGHISIPLADMAQYMENPISYAANRCLVSEDHYRQWLIHYQKPCCQWEFNDQVCGARVPRVDVPSQFVSGQHDRCEKHRSALGRSNVVSLRN